MPDDVTPDPADFVESPQDEAAAGGEPTSGNPDDPESQLEEPTDDETPDETPDGDGDDGTPLVARLRKESARYRRELRDAETARDELAGALWVERVTALGTLADPADLPFDAEALHDPDRLRELADELVTAKPHLRSRRVRQRVGQGEGTGPDGFSLAGMLRRGA